MSLTEIMGLALAGLGVIALDLWENGYRNITSRDKIVRKPEDFKGLKIRIPPTLFTEIYTSPFFMLAGKLMGSGGISNRLVAIVTSMFFAAISGSGPATVAALGAIVIPAMLGYKYHSGYASALMATAGAIGIIIPPSILALAGGHDSGAAPDHLYPGPVPLAARSVRLLIAGLRLEGIDVR